EAGSVPGVQHLDDVRVGAGDDLRDTGELPGTVGQRDVHLEVALIGGETAADHALHDHGIDVAAREHDDCRPLDGGGSGQQRGEPDGAGGLDDEFRALEQHDERTGDVVIAHGDDFVDGPADDLEVQGARPGDGDAVRDRRGDGDGCDLAGGER